jgi:hypothetical protein
VRYTPSLTCAFLLEIFSVNYFRQIDGCLQGYVNTVRHLRQHGGCLLGCTLSVIWGRLTVICRGVYSVSYTSQVGGCLRDVCNLLVIWGRLAVVCSGYIICQVLATRGLSSAWCVYSVTYMRQICDCLLGVCTLSVTWGRMAVVCCGVICHIHEADLWVLAEGCGVLCQLHEGGWRSSTKGGVYTVIYITRDGGCLLGVYSVTYIRQICGCLQGIGLRCTLSATWGRSAVVCKGAVCILSVTSGRLADVRGVCVNYISYFSKVGRCLQEVCNLVVIWGRLALSAADV